MIAESSDCSNAMQLEKNRFHCYFGFFLSLTKADKYWQSAKVPSKTLTSRLWWGSGTKKNYSYLKNWTGPIFQAERRDSSGIRNLLNGSYSHTNTESESQRESESSYSQLYKRPLKLPYIYDFDQKHIKLCL